MPALNDCITAPDFQLTGSNLVEASAGTGKTYNIQTLYLRLVVERGLRVQQILVVTFTDAATKELRDRLRRVLEDACRYDPQATADVQDRVRQIMDLPEIFGERTHNDDPKEKRWRIQRALLDFDDAAISTIHGFCQRVLDRFAFECRTVADTELIGGDRSAIDEVCEDWWRQNMYQSEPMSRACALLNILTVERLKQIAPTVIAKPDSLLRPDPDQPDGVTQEKVERAIEAAVVYWQQNGGAIRQAFEGARTEGFPMGRIVDHAIPQLDRLMQEGLAPIGKLGGLLAFSSDQIPKERKVDYTLPPRVAAFAEVCQEVSAIIKEKNIGISKGTWNLSKATNINEGYWGTVLASLQEAWRTNNDAIEEFLANGTPYLRAATREKLTDPEFVRNALAAFADPNSDPKTLKSAVVHFSPAKLEPLTKVRWDQPQVVSEFNQRCDNLAALAKSWLNVELVKAARQVRKDYEQRKSKARVKTFDDLLLNVRDSLKCEQTREALCNALREEYKVALIDEFQDTDPVQYDIFYRVFIEGRRATCVVGDPKQAIYAFRGGDVFTYYRAKDHVQQEDPNRIFWLDTNYRAEARLVDAINQLFRDRTVAGKGAAEESRRTFRENIEYPGTLKAEGLAGKDLLIGGQPDPKPFKLWYYTDLSEKTPGKYSPFAKRVYADTATEVVRVLNDGNQLIAGQRIRPADIAILVLDHGEAAMIHDELVKRDVAAVCQSTGRVFESAEAAAFAHVLAACAEPRSATRVRTALATMFFDCSNAQLIAMLRDEASGPPADKAGEQPPHRLEDWIAIFQQAHELWQKQSFIQAFNYLVGATSMRHTIVSRQDGERALTNLLHLSRLLHQAIVEQHLSIAGALTWYARQLDRDAADKGDEFEVRLESDDNAVRIMTVFRAKGLEFPIVFVPTMWRRKAIIHSDAGALEYHGAAGGDGAWRHCIDLRKTKEENEEGYQKMISERLAEDIRLLYVATTRAKHRTYLVWGSLGAEDTKSAMAWVLGTEPPEARLQAALGGDELLAVEVCEKLLKGVFISTVYKPETLGGDVDLTARAKPNVDKTQGHTSFSGLSPRERKRAEAAGERYDFDAPDVEREETSKVDSADKINIYNFPANAKVGECWHKIFEELDFRAGDSEIKPVVNDQLAAFGLDGGRVEAIQNRKREVVLTMVKNTLAAHLPVDGQPPIQLKDIPPEHCRAEMQFDFALPKWEDQFDETLRNRTTRITEILKKHWDKSERHKPFLDRLEDTWRKDIPQGFLTGFIDLVFKHGGKFYILDWKSNRRKGDKEDFDEDGLRAEMAEHAYFLQYLVYSVAVHQFLRGVKKDYDHEKHFGGVFYVFLRATLVDKPTGIYTDRPSFDLLNDLSAVLGRFQA